MIKHLFILLCIFLGIGASANVNDYVFEQVNPNTGITFNAITEITADRYGFIWFCCSNGLYYYNSAEIKKFNLVSNKPDAPRSNDVKNIYKDRTEKLWICTKEDICYFNEDENRFIRLNFEYDNGEQELKQITELIQISVDTFLTISRGQTYMFSANNHSLKHINLSEPPFYATNIATDDQNNVYISTSKGSVYKCNSSFNQIKEIYQTNYGSIKTVSCIDDKIWVGYLDHGIDLIDSNGKLLAQYTENGKGKFKISNNRIRSIIKGPEGGVWIASQGEISIVTKNNTYNLSDNPRNGLPHQGVFDLYKDDNDGVWATTWSGGLAYYNKYNYKFPHIKDTQIQQNKWNTVISGFTEDQQGRIWVGSENKGMNLYTPKDNVYEKVPNFPINRIKSLANDDKGRLWFGTLFEGLWLKDEQSVRRIGDIEGIFTTVLPTKKGVWIGGKGLGAVFYDYRKKDFQTFKANLGKEGYISSNSIWQIFEDSGKNLWFCHENGISMLRRNKFNFINFKPSEEPNNVSSSINYTMAEDRQGRIWIGTSGNGIDIYNPKTNTFSKFEKNKEIENAEVYCILKDHDHNIWFSSSKGVYAYYHGTNSLKHFTKEDGLQDQQYHPNSGFVSKNGVLYFGGGNGFNIIDPKTVHPNIIASDIYLSNLKINNQSIQEQLPKKINSQHLPAVNEMKLAYNQNSLTFAFVSNTYIKNSKSKFNYRLLNYMDEWTESEYNANISFIKIPHGKYTLQVQFLNNDGLSNAPLKEIEIEIKTPFWSAWYAYIAYMLFILGIIMIAIREVQFREESKAEHMVFTEKVQFFTNVSHEFRTPLTLIISPINSLIKRFSNEPQILESLNIIQRNSDRLLRLTNQILDFRLIEINNVKIKRVETDLVRICKNVYDCFEFQIKEKEINCIFNSSFKSFNLHIDPEKIEKVVYNLLSNALKYSDVKGQIIVSIEKNNITKESYSHVFTTGHTIYGDVIEIKIKDNGKGIDRKVMDNIFDRFFVDHKDNETGTGIGLHICQEYIKMHNGNIMVDSEPGKETTFTVNIPIESDIKYEKEKIIIQSHFDYIPDKASEEDASTSSDFKPLILFAEDNNELRKYYKKVLSYRYKVVTAKNGTQALEIANELVPSLIISDILMPGIDGMALTEEIRNTEKIKHIPIILLTALSDNQLVIESMQKGANSYLTKPVDETLLLAKIENIFANTNVLAKHYKADNKDTTNDPGSDSFIQKAEKIVEENLQKQTFEITELALLIGISRSSLQRKIKKLANMSPSEFIREVRLKKAIVLLKNGDYNIDEIAIMVGFNSTSYFIRSFKKKYDMTPTAYRQRINDN